jgi:undecaprenyl-diphosphatase
MAIIIGAAQVLALWPGTSRSLVTILAALFLGMSMPAALEFSFLLGLATLSAATLFEALKHGGELLDTYGLLNPLIGFVVAFVAAVIAVRWLVSYLSRHGLELFGWYRIVVAAIAIVLVITGTI